MKNSDKQTVLIGLDGASFKVLDPLMENGTMPFLKKFVSSGCRGELTSVTPPLTPPAWTSLITGCLPRTHGILDFLQFESPKSRYIKWISFRDIQRETIWSIVSRHGMRAGSLNFIAMNPPPAISGYVIPGFVSWRFLKKNSHPHDLFDRLQSIPEFDVKEMALNFREEEKAVKGCQNEEYESWILLHIRRERQWFRVARYLLQADPCHFMGFIFDGLDRIQHVCWRFLDPECLPETLSPWEERTRQLCIQYFRELDGFIEEIVTLAGPQANIFIASDHGFGPTQKILYINQWLCERGYLKWKDNTRVPDKDEESLGVESPYRSLVHLDWKKTKAYATTASSNGIVIQVAGKRGEEGIPPESYQEFREELIRKLYEDCFDPDTGEPLIKKIWTKEEVFSGDFIDYAPDLTLTLQDSGFFSINPSESYFRQRSQIRGTHRPEGIFIAAGPAIQPGQVVNPLSIIDMAPAMLHTLGVPIPQNMEGKVMTEVFDPEFLRSHPLQIGEPTLPPERYQDENIQTEDAEGQEQIMLRLKSLGYV
jgi:predicted AlkP superfamily phosphohydrolase/phosphomutase